ncbi:MAG: DUF1572 family protein [Candidatus Hydrogenedentes bacterium]|nr:DUF1572 family protein [Candidatus Hydrogenedentota bacterium]
MIDHELGTMFLDSVQKRFENVKALGDGALDQLKEDEYYRAPSPESTSVSILLQHLHGNMMSRWTDFLNSDGEKPTRDRDSEFVEQHLHVETLMEHWEAGWACLFHALGGLETGDLAKEVRVRGAAMSALDAIERQLSHYSYHVGQIVYLARMFRDAEWQTLSIPKGGSGAYQATPRD